MGLYSVEGNTKAVVRCGVGRGVALMGWVWLGENWGVREWRWVTCQSPCDCWPNLRRKQLSNMPINESVDKCPRQAPGDLIKFIWCLGQAPSDVSPGQAPDQLIYKSMTAVHAFERRPTHSHRRMWPPQADGPSAVVVAPVSKTS